MKSFVPLVAVTSLVFVAMVSTICPDQTTVNPFDVPSYMGQWYEIAQARLSRGTFEKNLYCSGANYTFVASDGIVLVNNTGHIGSANGPLSEADGKAQQTDPTTNPGALAVTFSGTIPNEPNYFVLDTDYVSYTMVGGSCKSFLWILSRTPQMADDTYNMLVNQAIADGYQLQMIGFKRDNTTDCTILPPA